MLVRVDDAQKIALEFELRKMERLAGKNEELKKSVRRLRKTLAKMGVLA